VPRLDRAYAAQLPAWPRLMEDEERVPDVPEEFRKKTKRRTVNVTPAVPVETKLRQARWSSTLRQGPQKDNLAATKTIEAQRERVCALLKQYVSSQTGPALIGVKDFSRILRQAGIVNASPDPWIHGYVGPGAMGTEFEADDYDEPTVLCLGKKGRLITSRKFDAL